MSLLQATLALYRDAGTDTLKALPRSGVALLFLLLGGAFELVLGSMLGGAGMAGGFVLGLVDAFLTGWYLALLHVLVMQSRRLRMDDLQEHMGQLFFEVITIGFVFGIPRLILAFTAPQIVLPYVLIVALLFNPIPEMIYQERADAMSLIGRSMAFMRDNWPEWMVGHALVFGLLGLGLQALTGAGMLVLPLVFGLYGPWMEFMGLGTLGLGLLGLGPVGVTIAAFLIVGSHAVMVFRGALYKRLSRSSRRSRAWQSQIR